MFGCSEYINVTVNDMQRQQRIDDRNDQLPSVTVSTPTYPNSETTPPTVTLADDHPTLHNVHFVLVYGCSVLSVCKYPSPVVFVDTCLPRVLRHPDCAHALRIDPDS